MRKKTGVLGSISFQITLTKEKERAKRKKGGEEKRAMDALFVFIMATLAGKKILDAKAPYGGNVVKNPARYVRRKTTKIKTSYFAALQHRD